MWRRNCINSYEAIDMKFMDNETLERDSETHNSDSESVTSSEEDQEADKKISRNWMKSVLVWIKGAGVALFTLWQFAALAYVTMEVLGAILLKEWAIAEVEATIDVMRNASSNNGDSRHSNNMSYFTQYCSIKLGNCLL